ncbi:hypothetical protein V5F40_07975 [Xanthobacter sp. DSM 14520]|uniref:hypothetical protein n=1 Tax=Xanthobacter autotrophicus (strain ATCC BAA-1158 / Py2) TaxID=78245 RepID=UPI00372AD377
MTYPKSRRTPPFPGPRPGRATPHAVWHALGLALSLCALALLPGLARAHEWYPAYCCSGQDCYEIGPEDVEFVGQGYFIKATGEYYPRDAVPESPDGKFHRCSIQGKREARTLCLFAPTPAF